MIVKLAIDSWNRICLTSTTSSHYLLNMRTIWLALLRVSEKRALLNLKLDSVKETIVIEILHEELTALGIDWRNWI